MKAAKDKILVVEDDPSWQVIYADRLEDCDLTIVSDLQSAKDAVDRRRFPVAIVDIRLQDNVPGNEDGLEVAKYIQEKEEGTSIIMVTGHGTVQSATIAFRDLGVYNFLEKNDTIPTEQLRELVRGGMEKAHNITAPFHYIDPLQLLNKMTLKELAGILAIGTEQEIRNIIQYLMRPYQPLLGARSKPVIHTVPLGNRPVVDIRYWSKSLGQPVVLRLANRSLAENDLPKTELTLDQSEDLGSNIKGRVYLLSEEKAPFSEFDLKLGRVKALTHGR